MARAKKDGTALNIKIENDVNEKLVNFCENTGFSKTAAVENALDKYIDDYYKSHPEEIKNT